MIGEYHRAKDGTRNTNSLDIARFMIRKKNIGVMNEVTRVTINDRRWQNSKVRRYWNGIHLMMMFLLCWLRKLEKVKILKVWRLSASRNEIACM